MKKVILDENIPQPFRYDLDMFEVYTVGYLGWAGIKNGELINKIDGDFDLPFSEPVSKTGRHDAGGITSCSRWLSEATPPENVHLKPASRQGCQP